MSGCSDVGFLFVLVVTGYLVVSGLRRRSVHAGIEERLRRLTDAQAKLRDELALLRAEVHARPAAETHAAPGAAAAGMPAATAIERPIETVLTGSAEAETPVEAEAACPAAPPAGGILDTQPVPTAWPAPLPSEPPPLEPPPSPPGAPEPAAALPTPPAPRFPGLAAGLRKFDWESLVGVRLFSWIAGVALLVATVSFLRYSIEHGWMGPPVRLAIGLATGVALLVACETRRAQRYRVTAHALTAAGIAILFSTFYASHALWRLIGAIPVFVLLALVTAVAVALSIRRESMFIALLGLLGGFATPVLLSTGEDRPIGLFSYLLLLNVALAWVAYRKRWPALTAASLGFTALYQAGWVIRFLDTSKMPLAVGIFLVFPIAGFGALLLSRRRAGGGEAPLFARTASFGALPPLLLALYLAVVPVYGERFGLLFGFLFLVALGLAAVAAFLGPEWLHLAGAGSVLLVFACWLGLSYTPEAWPWALALVGLFVALYLGAPLLLRRLGHAFGAEGHWATLTAPLLLFAFPVLAFLEHRTEGPALFFGSLFALLVALAAHAVASQDGRVHLIAGFFALAAQAVWSAKHLAPERLLPALLVYAGFALFHLGVPLFAERRGKALRPQGGAAILLFASLALLFFLAAGPIARVSLWVLAILLLVLPVGLLFEASRGRHPFLAPIGIAVSWLALAVWWVSAPLVALLVPALVVMAGFALLALGGSLWAERQAGRDGRGEALPPGRQGAFLGLAGHGFLLAVVLQPRLAVPPWPWLGVMALLDLALLVAALWARRGALQLGAVVASVAILGAFAIAGSPGAPGPPALAVVTALALAALALAGPSLADRRGAPAEIFTHAAEAALFGGQFVTVVTSHLEGCPGLALLVPAHVVLLVGILWIAWRQGRPGDVLAAVASCGLAVFGWRAENPGNFPGVLWLATPLYLVLLFHPFVSRRFRTGRLHYVAAIAASAVYFFFAREALLQAGLSSAIGLLPVCQALLLVPHLWLLVRLTPPQERDPERIALVAAALLAFVTVAIPLQLEKQWITLGWALQAAALAWLNRRIPHKGLVTWLSALLAAVFIRLALNPEVLSYYPRSAVPVLNWYLYTYLVAAACFFAAARWLRSGEDRLLPQAPRISTFLPAMGAVLLFLLLNLEIADFWSKGDHITFDFSAGLAQDLSYTIGWGLFAIGLLAAGVVAKSRTGRVASIALLAITVLKAFLHDLKNLTGLYRVGSFVGLAVCLALVALVLQRFVLSSRKEKA